MKLVVNSRVPFTLPQIVYILTYVLITIVEAGHNKSLNLNKVNIVNLSREEKVLSIQPVKCFVTLTRFEIWKSKEQSLDTFILRSRMF